MSWNKVLDQTQAKVPATSPNLRLILRQAFTRICNTYLQTRGLVIQDGELVNGALDDGVILFHLVTVMSGKEVGKLVQPKTRAHKLDNLTVSLNFLGADGVRLIGIGAEGIAPKPCTPLSQVNGCSMPIVPIFHCSM